MKAEIINHETVECLIRTMSARGIGVKMISHSKNNVAFMLGQRRFTFTSRDAYRFLEGVMEVASMPEILPNNDTN